MVVLVIRIKFFTRMSESCLGVHIEIMRWSSAKK